MSVNPILVIALTLLMPAMHPPAKETADALLVRGTIHTVSSHRPVASAMALAGGKILAVGDDQEILSRFEAPRIIDLSGRHIYPGFIDAHCHFVGFAEGMQYVDLLGCRSFAEVLERLHRAHDPSKPGWLIGRGWDQNLWPEKEFPGNDRLNERYPATPVMLIRVDGHVVLANRTALDMAGITGQGGFGAGQVEMKGGRMTGILSETAADRMRAAVPSAEGETLASLLGRAEQRCFSAGLTLVSDAGLEFGQVRFLDSLHKAGRLKMQVYAMLSPSSLNIREWVERGPYLSERLTVRSIKLYADGSLGSRTAWLKSPYSDMPSTSGLSVTTPDSVRSLCRLAFDHGYQVCAHCIGDSANRMILNIFGEFLQGKNDRRWRIEHAQVVDPVDLRLFSDFSIIPSVQATHATSDMRWAGDRLGSVRVRWAYAYRDLLQANGWIPNGTDFPIEDISPLMTFFAAVARTDASGYPDGGFQSENALSRQDALKSITLWAARAGFLDDRKGSLEPGKDADFVVLDHDILTVPEGELLQVKVLQTWLLGERVWPSETD